MGYMRSRYENAAPMTPLENAKWDRQYAMQQLRKPYVKADAKLRSTWESCKAEAEKKIAQLEAN